MTNFTFGQCKDIARNLEKLERIPYLLIDKTIYEIKSDCYIKIKGLRGNKKARLVFIMEGFKNPIEVTMLTLNRHKLVKKTITKEDNTLSVIPKKSETYYLLIDINEDPRAGNKCIGLAILERTNQKRFQKIIWEKSDKFETDSI
jgi:hypothetical protein